MPINMHNAFISAFLKFPEYNFIWKFEGNENITYKNAPNVFKFKWVNQKAILSNFFKLLFNILKIFRTSKITCFYNTWWNE